MLEQVDLLKGMGIDKIVLMDHAQDFTGDPLSAMDLRDIDIIVAAGSTGFMARETPTGPFNFLRQGDGPGANYPTVRDDMDGNPVVVVNSDQLYRYIGNLIVGFDAAGIVNFIDLRSGPIATSEEAVAALGAEIGIDPLEASATVQGIWADLMTTPLITSQFTPVGTTGFPLNGERADVRNRETNLGRVVSDSTLWGAQRYLDDNAIPLDVDIALKNGGGIRDTIEGPNIIRLTIGAALAFNNRLSIVEIRADELLASMENAVSRWPARDGRFPQVAGMSMKFDPARPGVMGQTSLVQPSRIQNLTVTKADGSELVIVDGYRFLADPAETFVLATNNFLLTGGDGYGALAAINDDPARTTYETVVGEQQILADYIAGPLGGNVSVEDPPPAPRVALFSYGEAVASTEAGVFDEGSAEIVAYCPVAKRLFVSNANDSTVDIFDARGGNPIPLDMQIDTLGGAPNSVATSNGVLAVAVENDPKQDPGWVVFYDTLYGRELSRVEVGELPDMLTFTPDGTKLLVANEGEPNDANTIDPPGSISVIDLGEGFVDNVDDLTADDVTRLGFESLDLIPYLKKFLVDSGIRMFGQIYDEEGNFVRETTIAEDLEPEYIAVSPDSSTAFAILQENNTLAVIDLTGTPAIVDLLPLGFKDHSAEGNGFDASDRDGGINIMPHPVLGMYQPDAIAAFDAFGETYIISANEGDSRDYDGFSEEVRVADLALDPEAYPNAAELQSSAALGRLKTTTTMGDYDGDGDVDQIFSYGARSFSIWDSAGNLVWDSGDQFEQIIAARFPSVFNASNDNASFDNRSDDKGPEPEGVVVGRVGDRTWAFVGLERMGGFMIYDITFPQEPFFVDYVNDRNFDVDPESDFPAGGQLGPEGLLFLDPADSPLGVPTLVVASEVSGTTAMYAIEEPVAPKFTLQLLHSSDNESFFQDPNTGEVKILGYGAVVEGLRKLGAKEQMSTLYLTAGDHTLPNAFYEASAEVPEFGSPGLADIAFYNAMGLVANGMGNHEFDGGIDDFAEMLATANYPFIAANLEFSDVELADGTTPIEIGVDGASVEENAGKVCRSAHVEIGGERIGLIGRAPADFFNIVADPDTTLPGLDFVGGRDGATNQPIESALGQVLEQVDLLKARGIDKIILLDHAQDFTADPLSAQNLRDIDILVTAGSTGFMASAEVTGPFNLLREGDTAETAYPTERTDMDGNTVLVVNSDQLYSYVGQLIVCFDLEGRIESFDTRSGPVATTSDASALLGDELGLDGSCAPNNRTVEIWDAISSTPLISDLFEVVGTTTGPLNGTRADVRSRETNLGVLAADSTLWFARQFVEGEGKPVEVDVALKNGGGIRADIIGPNITRLAIGTALAFDNRLAILELTAEELLATMENAVSRFPATDGRFPHVAGMTVVFDPSQPGMEGMASLSTPSRIVALEVERADGSIDLVVDAGVLVGDPGRTFGLATNNFLATGGDGYAALRAVADDPAREVCETAAGEQQILAEYITGPLGGEVDIPDPTTGPRVDQVASPLLANFAAWAAEFMDPADPDAAIDADFDCDGHSNLFAYAFDIDPTRRTAGPNLPRPTLDVDSLLVTMTVQDDPALAFRFEGSSDLSNWVPFAEGEFTVDSEVANGDGTRTLTARFPRTARRRRNVHPRGGDRRVSHHGNR